MKVLIVPMAAMAETSGPSGRCRILAAGFRDADIETATCMAEDVNYRTVDGIYNYYLDVPMPLGLPELIATRTFPIAQKLGITSRKTVNSFDEVLWLTGNLDYGYLKASVDSVRSAIRKFKPDVVYSEFNISAIIAAGIEQIPLAVTVSYPTQHEYAHRSDLAKGLNRLLSELGLQEVDSALQLFDRADKKFCPSIFELEPIKKPDVYFCGALKSMRSAEETKVRDKIVVYMGNGTVSPTRMLKSVQESFKGGKYDVYLASASLKETDYGNIHVAQRWDFDELLDEAVLFINHGGQNSIVDGLIHGVPQIMIPGKVFERRYNARSVVDNGAGVEISINDLCSSMIKEVADQLIESPDAAEKAAILGGKLMSAGGVGKIVEGISEIGLKTV